MKSPISDIAFTPAVKAAQEQRGSRKAYAKMEDRGGWQNKVTGDLVDFVGQRDSFYLATASADGQPYIQHRGGAKGFLKVLDEHTLAFADFVGKATDGQLTMKVFHGGELVGAFENFDGFIPSRCQYWKLKVWPGGAQTLPPQVGMLPPPPEMAFRTSIVIEPVIPVDCASLL